MASTSLALSNVAKDTPGLSALVSTQQDIDDILDLRIPYDRDVSFRRRLLSDDSEFSLAESNLRQPRASRSSISTLKLQREVDELDRMRKRRTGGDYAIRSFPLLQTSRLRFLVDASILTDTSTRCGRTMVACHERAGQ
jgi:hypothetical protein